jgi:hypothetical protein
VQSAIYAPFIVIIVILDLCALKYKTVSFCLATACLFFYEQQRDIQSVGGRTLLLLLLHLAPLRQAAMDVIIDFELLFEKGYKPTIFFTHTRAAHSRTNETCCTRLCWKGIVNKRRIVFPYYTRTHACARSRNMLADNGRVNMGSLCLHGDEN